jgi:hypothetical protein
MLEEIGSLCEIKILMIREHATAHGCGIGRIGGVRAPRQVLKAFDEARGLAGEAEHLVDHQHLTVTLSRPGDRAGQRFDNRFDDDAERTGVIERRSEDPAIPPFAPCRRSGRRARPTRLVA